MSIFSRFLILILLQTISSSVYADETGYEVELIIFEDTTNRYLQSEDWRYNDMLNKKHDVIVEDKSLTIDNEFKELDWKESKLIPQYNRLSSSNKYRILATKRWKQTGLDRKHAFNIPINMPSDSIEENSVSDEMKNTQNALTTEDTVESESSDIDLDEPETIEHTEPYITGNVKLIMSRYLHFNIDLKYIKPQNNTLNDTRSFDESHELRSGFNEQEDTVSDESSISFPIVNERRMRSREIHYIDHPLVGVIVLATPYKIKPPEEEITPPIPYKTM